MKCKCPNCGTKFKMKAKKLKDKVAEYVEEIVPHMNTCKPLTNAKKFRTNTDVGSFRQALYNAGFIDRADELIFNDKNVDSRRLKLWFAGSVVNATEAQKQKLDLALQAQFGDRLLRHGAIKGSTWRGHVMSYAVHLKL